MLEFVNYLKESFKEDTSSAEKIIKDKWNKVVAIIKEAFDDPYSDKKTALYRIQSEFIDSKIAPKSIDVEFLKNNMDYVVEKVNSLDEGEIRIIINNDVQKGSAGASVTGMETESKRGRKKDVVKEEMDEVEPTDEIGGEIEMGGSVGDSGDEEEKTVKVSVEDNKVTVEPSENTGLEKSEHEFEDEEEASAFVASLENLFKGFRIEKAEPTDGDIEDVTSAAETEEESTKSKKRLVSEAEGDEEPEDAGEESEDAGEEPEDAGEEPEDAGEEPEDAGEEPEDAGEIDWEDVEASEGDEDAEECIVAPVRPIGSMERPELESLDLNKLINTLVRVEDKWYKVNSISENNEVICVDRKGTENYFDLEQIEEMEQTLGELAKSVVAPNAGEEETEEPAEEGSEPADAEECVPCKKGKEGAEEEVGLAVALSPEQMAELKVWIANPEEDPSDELYQTLMDYYADEMPYGVQKARTGDPYEWLLAKTSADIGDKEEAGEEEYAEEEISKEDESEAEEEMGTQEESLSFTKLANRYMDLEEDALSPPSMLNTQSGGLTSKVGMPPEKLEKPGKVPSSETKPGPESALTAKATPPKEKVEPAGKAPTAKTKPGPDQKLTSKPKAPPRKVEKVSAPKEMPKKNSLKGSFTSKPMKVKTNISNVKAPVIPAEYKKGGHKG